MKKKCVYIHIKWNYIVSERNSYKKKYGVGETPNRINHYPVDKC